MKGKIGLVIGLGAGYVLGTRAGRERYEQIKREAKKIWQLDPVQNQVTKVKSFAKSSALAVPRTLWNGAMKVGAAVLQDNQDAKPAVTASKSTATKSTATKSTAAKAKSTSTTAKPATKTTKKS